MRGSRLRDMRALSFASQPLPQSAAKPKHHFALDSRPEVRSVIKSLFFFRGYYCWWWAFDRFDWGSDFRPLEMNFYKQAFLFVCRAPRCNAIQSLDTTSGVHSHWLGTVPNKVDRVVTMTSRSWSSHDVVLLSTLSTAISWRLLHRTTRRSTSAAADRSSIAVGASRRSLDGRLHVINGCRSLRLDPQRRNGLWTVRISDR